jgi:hypothetical protein
MVLALFFGAALTSRTMAMEHTGRVGEHTIHSVWRTITRNSKFRDDIRNVTPSQGYTFIRPDGTSCFDVSKDAYITFAEKRGEKGILVLWRAGGVEFKKTETSIEGIHFQDHGNTVAVESRSNDSKSRTTLFKVVRGMPTIASYDGIVIGSNSTCAVISNNGSTFVRLIKSGKNLEKKRLDIEKMLVKRAFAVGRISGTNASTNQFSELTVSPDCQLMFESTVHSNPEFEAKPLSDVSGLFSSSAEIWEWRSDGVCTEAFFLDSEHLVFKIGDSFKMGPPNKLKTYKGGLYILNCRTKTATRSSMTEIKERLGLPGTTMVHFSP